MKAFTITSFAWRKDTEERLRRGGYDEHEIQSDNVILEALSEVARFLDENKLSTRKLTGPAGTVGPDFVLSSDDVTELGMAVIRAGFGKWEKKGGYPRDVVVLEKALAKLKQ